MGVPVLCAGQARYTHYPTVFFPETLDEYQNLFNEFLRADQIPAVSSMSLEARRFLYYQLKVVSLEFSDFILSQETAKGQTLLEQFELSELSGENCTIKLLNRGILKGESFTHLT